MAKSSPEGIELGKGSQLVSMELSINKEKVLSIESQKRSYSEEEALELLQNFNKHTLQLQSLKLGNSFRVDEWFEQFKKK